MTRDEQHRRLTTELCISREVVHAKLNSIHRLATLIADGTKPQNTTVWATLISNEASDIQDRLLTIDNCRTLLGEGS